MFDGIARAIRFGKAWKMGTSRLREMELALQRPDGPFPATLLVPTRIRNPLPGWVALHGITRPGRTHPTLVRFVRALAASGYVVLVPEVPEWREMKLAPKEAADTLRSAVLALASREETVAGRLGVMGFSFGGPQALMAGADPVLLPHLKAVASFGGYCDVEATLRFFFSGEHEWDGVRYRAVPDPYGRWVAGGNYLPWAPGYGGTEDVAQALLDLAREAGDLRVASWDPVFDRRKQELADALPPSKRELFRAFAPAEGDPIPREAADTLVPALADAARRDSSLFDITPLLANIQVPVRLVHGRQDRLIPFTETLRLAQRFSPVSDVQVFLTGLFSHSHRHGGRYKIQELREQLRFLRLMSVVSGTI
jgi:pimeloyl-ACP methyl ester carboxylesterase